MSKLTFNFWIWNFLFKQNYSIINYIKYHKKDKKLKKNNRNNCSLKANVQTLTINIVEKE